MKKILAVSLILSSVALTIVALAAPSPRSTLKGSKPSWANSKNYAGNANANNNLGFRIYLGWNNPSGAEALARAVSDPRSKSYRHYLTPAQFRQQFAPTANQVAQVQSWLTSQGFTLVYTPANNHYVSAEGTVGQAQAAFGVSFGKYNVKVLGLTLRSPSADVSIPSSLASLVTGVAGLDESYEFIRPNHSVDSNAPPSDGFRNSPPLSAYWAELHGRARAAVHSSSSATGVCFSDWLYRYCPSISTVVHQGAYPAAGEGRLRHLRPYGHGADRRDH